MLLIYDIIPTLAARRISPAPLPPPPLRPRYQQLKGKRKVEYLGGRFSLKESFSKALGTGLGKYVGFQDIETLWDDLGHPVMTSTKFSGNIFASITHDDHEIITGVVLEELN